VRIILALAVLLASGLGIAPAFSAAAGRPARPERVVSLNLCADQYLLALADRAQIASLSPLSRDPEYSFLAGRAGDLPVNGGTGEEILVDEADLVLSGRYGTRVKREMLQRHGVPMMVLDPWRDVAEGREQLLAVAARLRHSERIG